MAITRIKRFENRSSSPVSVLDIETPSAPGHGVAVPAGGVLTQISMFVPWATAADAFVRQHLEIQVAGQTRFWVWQCARWDGDHVRFSKDGAWHDPGTRAHGASVVDGDRTLIVKDGCFELLALPQDLLDQLIREERPPLLRLAADQPPGEPARPSVPKRQAVAFSMAGLPSDAFDRGIPGARFLYRDTGKRYEFRIDDTGVVNATHPDGTTTRLVDAVTYQHHRGGTTSAAPPFDLIAASSGRMFAKERDGNRFYIATMDNVFVHGDDWGEVVVPSNYFKLDPEFLQPGVRVDQLTAHLDGCFLDHPAAERFPLFRALLELGLTDLMIVKVQRRVWHEVDLRPPAAAFNVELVGLDAARRILDALGALPWGPLGPAKDEIERWKTKVRAQRDAIVQNGPDIYTLPAGVTGYDHVRLTDGTTTYVLRNISFQRVLDLGVGATHHHEQYDGTTGGEMQPMLARPVAAGVTYADLYRIMNGPIRDGDSFIDGTCNYYILAQLKPDEQLGTNGGLGVSDAFGVLFFDEQSYFSARWRLAHPDDSGGGGLSLAKALEDELSSPTKLYNWNKANYWCPLRAGHVSRRSRMAVARQVVLVNGQEPVTGVPALYSVNYSFASMDRTWRWRMFPAEATVRQFPDDAAAGREDIRTDVPGGTVVYPETVRLREDMTIHVKGARGGVVGRWYQRYLPSGNQLVPPAAELVGGRPRRGYTHQWRFLQEAAFAAADTFSHLGVHAPVDSRCHYYPVDPLTLDAASALQQAAPGSARVYAGEDLYVRVLRFWWAAPLRVPDFEVVPLPLPPSARPAPRRPASVMNAVTRLRIVPRDQGWIALHWDKRDDDLVPFDDLPKEVEVTNGALRARLRINPATWVDTPPTVARIDLVLTGDPTAPVAIALKDPRNVWRVRAAYLADFGSGRVPRVAWILDAPLSTFTTAPNGTLERRWAPPATELAAIQTALTRAGAEASATAVWVEDTVGHVGVPDEVRWLRTMTATATPAKLPLGVPAAWRVDARDRITGAAVQGFVDVTGVATAATGIPLTTMFQMHQVRVFDPSTRTWSIEDALPEVGVRAAGYRDVSVPVSFYWPALRVSVDQAFLPVGRATQVTVRAFDATTGAAVAGSVRIAGQDVGATNAPFTYTFPSAAPAAVAEAAGYPSAAITWPPLRPPRLNVTIQPSPIPFSRPVSVTVAATDADYGGAVDGAVSIDGRAVGRTNVAFTYTLVTRRVRTHDPTTGAWNVELILPVCTVSATGYPNVSITLDGL